MNIKLVNKALKSPEIELVEKVSSETIAKCYQCGNCTGGCPVSYAMDLPPTRMIRALQLGRFDEAASAESMWICVGCLQCYSRCPQGVSAANIFEALRQLSLRSGRDKKEIKDIPIEFLKKAPQQAIVCGFRKFVG
ncbi:MAG TPA: 4Fe-4S dicluster domain-containing protein [Thermodesulfobacteriota bacterium]|nr:4Fe-4S dicluster domain-containing protein [Thermodesulfobacteriota bacterium]